MKDIKQLYRLVYLLFLLAMFLLFATVQNMSQLTVWVFFSFFLALLLGSILFVFLAFSWTVSATLKDQAIVENIVLDLSTESFQKEKFVSSKSSTQVLELMPERSESVSTYSEKLLINISKEFHLVQALFYLKIGEKDIFSCIGKYAYFSDEKPVDFSVGETIPGQAVKNNTIVTLSNIPESYLTIVSGLGMGKPKELVFVPISFNDEVIGLIEYASFEPLTEAKKEILEKLSNAVAEVIVKFQKK